MPLQFKPFSDDDELPCKEFDEFCENASKSSLYPSFVFLP